MEITNVSIKNVIEGPEAFQMKDTNCFSPQGKLYRKIASKSTHPETTGENTQSSLPCC
jgi:hypothetical protein